ncbi:partial Alkyl hydroperoxide reductase subunit F, partial [Anaerolineae bacterium]
MLDNNIQEQLKAYLQRLQHRIEIVATLDGSPKAQEMREMLHEIAALSDLVSLREDGNNQRRPSFGIGLPGEAPRVHFAGIPMGHEFTSLVLALLQVGGHPPKVSDEVLAQIRGLRGEFNFETYISLTCHNCPDVVQALNLMAIYNPGIQHVMIDGGMFPDEVAERQIMAVPTAYMNGEVFERGRVELEQILAKIDTSGV